MKRDNIVTTLSFLTVLIAIVFLGPGNVSAHCDGMDGPVVKAAQKALETGNVNLVLIWVQKKDEAVIKKSFERTLDVRKLNPDARELADMCFFETLVRVHRAGEGASFTGLKPAGRDLGPAIPAADKAILDGKAELLLKHLTDTMQDDIREQFKQVIAKKNFNKDDVEAGREYIETYVSFIHYVERLYDAAKRPAYGHYLEPEEGGAHKD